jgi:hypothetical protein
MKFRFKGGKYYTLILDELIRGRNVDESCVVEFIAFMVRCLAIKHRQSESLDIDFDSDQLMDCEQTMLKKVTDFLRSNHEYHKNKYGRSK